MLSVIIPARNEPYLSQTVSSLLSRAHKLTEIIVVFEGPPYCTLPSDPRVISIFHPEPVGMRSSINEGVRIARGKYIMKCDAHCLFEDGFDEKLIPYLSMGSNDLIVPREYGLDVQTWTRIDTRRGYSDYQYIDTEFKGKWWPEKDAERMDVEVDDLMAFQGSCWLMEKKRFEDLGLMDVEHYGEFAREAQELALKVWLNGGKCLIHKGTWYAHWRKPKDKGYTLEGGTWKKAKDWCKEYWPGEPGFDDFIAHFNPPGWQRDNSLYEHIERVGDVERILTKHPKYDFDNDNKVITLHLEEGRTALAELFSGRGAKKGAEIGVLYGKFSQLILDKNPQLEHLYSIDPYVPYPIYNTRQPGQIHDPRRMEGFRAKALQRLKPYIDKGQCTMVRKTSLEAVHDFVDESLDFVYIDGDHSFDGAMLDIILWSPKVRSGGIVAGHDYRLNYNLAVKEAVDAYHAYHKEISPLFVIHEKNRVHSYSHSWFYIKP